MECVLQWLDDLDDLWSSLASHAEHMRRIAIACAVLLGFLAFCGIGAVLAFHSPPLALALVCLMTVTALYRGTVVSRKSVARS